MTVYLVRAAGVLEREGPGVLPLTAGPDIDLAQELEARCREHDLGLEIGDVGSIIRFLKRERPVHVVIDRRAMGIDEVDAAHGLIGRLEQEDVLVSVFYDALTEADISDVFTCSVMDQVLEVRDAADVREALDMVAEHACTSRRPLPEDAVAIGDVYPLGTSTYDDAKAWSLVTRRMEGFVDELRSAVVRLSRHRLATTLPWDPEDDQPAERAAWDPESKSWALKLGKGNVPNLIQVFNAHETASARARLAGKTVAEAEPAWDARWDDSKPPLLLITGESGTGKTLVARTIADRLTEHQKGPRGLLVKINCGGLTESTFTHVLMGTAPGMWTGVQSVVGELTRAAHGVVFLDEIGDLDPDVQRAILTFLDDRKIRPTGMGSFRGFQHIIAATNRDLGEGANQHWFRNDLLARFTMRVHIPPLRERGREEIAQLLDFVAQDPTANPERNDRPRVEAIAADAYEDLLTREYRNGNLRELQQVVHGALRSAIRRRSRVLERCDLPPRQLAHVRADRDSSRVRVQSVVLPYGTLQIPVSSEQDLRLLAQREGRVMLTDENGQSWVITPGAAYRSDTERRPLTLPVDLPGCEHGTAEGVESRR